MKYIFGLGNPGTQHDGTRHTIGFAVIDALVSRWLDHESFTLFGAEKKKTYEAWEFRYHSLSCADAERIYCIKPLTFMNRSGEIVGDWVKYAPSDFGIQTDLWIIHDELDLPLGSIKIGMGSSSAGHNGVQSIIDALDSNAWTRFRVGIYPLRAPSEPIADFVLKRFTPSERILVETSLARTRDAVEYTLSYGIAKAQTNYNAKQNASNPSLSANGAS